MKRETPLWGRSCRCAHMNQVSGLGLYTVLQLCWTVLPALMPGNARLFFLALLQVNSGELTLIWIVFLKNVELHTWYFIVGSIFCSKNPLSPESLLGVAVPRGLFTYCVCLCHKLPMSKGSGYLGRLSAHMWTRVCLCKQKWGLENDCAFALTTCIADIKVFCHSR